MKRARKSKFNKKGEPMGKEKMSSFSTATRRLLSRLKALAAPTAPEGRALEEKSFKSLYEMARKKRIKGRSKMNKKQLAKSLAQRRL